MKNSSSAKLSLIDKQISYLLSQMGKAMPEVRRKVQVYEDNLKPGASGIEDASGCLKFTISPK
jgi:hypothetical protein